MAKKRDFATEIVAKRSRSLKRGDRWDHMSARIDPIIYAYEFLDRSKQQSHREARGELLKYIAIGLVACMESYFRSAIRDLIDFGAPYDLNARGLDDARIDISTVLGLGREKITIGEFISHVISIRGMDDINRNMSIVLGEDYLTKLKTIHNDVLGETIEKIAGKLLVDLESVFAQRHIFCHEFAPKIRPRLRDQKFFIGSVLNFTYTTDLMLEQLLKK